MKCGQLLSITFLRTGNGSEPFPLLDLCGDSRKAREAAGFSSVPGVVFPLRQEGSNDT